MRIEINDIVKIIDVKIVPGSTLKIGWRFDNQKIFIEGFQGFFVDEMKISWKDYIGKNISGISSNEKEGIFWLNAYKKQIQVEDNNIINSSISAINIKLDNKSDGYFKNFRLKYPPKYRTKDGHFVRSRAEVIIDNALYGYKVVHTYERKLPILENVYSDFYIPSINGSEPVYIEYWGLENDESYLERKTVKQKIYNNYSYKLIELSNIHIENLDDYLPSFLLKYGLNIE